MISRKIMFKIKSNALSPVLNIILNVILLASLVIAQTAQQDSAKSLGKEEIPVINAIPASDIVRTSEAISLYLNEMRTKLESDPAIVDIDTTFPGYAKILEDDRKGLDATLLERMTLNQLNNLRTNWLQHKQKIDQWQGVVDARVQVLASGEKNINQIKMTWQATEKAAMIENYPEALQERISSVINEINKLEMILSKREEIVLTLQDKVSNTSITIVQLLKQIDTSMALVQGRLFTPDNPPLWHAFKVDEGQESSVLIEIRTSWDKRLDSYAKFLQNNQQAIILHTTFFILLLIFMFVAQKQIRKWQIDPEDQALKTSAFIFYRPISTALLISLLSARLFYPNLSVDVYRLFGLLTVIPILRLLIHLLSSDMRISLYALTLLYILHRIFDLLYEQPILQRLFLFALTVIILAGLFWLIRPNRPNIKPDWGRFWRIIVVFVKIGIVILGLSITANIFGYMGLSALLTTGYLKSTYIAVGLLTGVVVLRGILIIILRAAFLRKLHMVKANSHLIQMSFNRFFNIIAILIWAWGTLSYFNISDAIIGWMGEILGHRLTIGNFDVSPGDIIAFIITIYLSVKISQFIRFVLNEDVLPRIKLPRGVPASISMVAHYFILAFGFIIAMSAAGIEWSRFAIIAGALGVGIGFGLQNLVNNFVSGLILIFERPIKIGDTIEVGSLLGTVRRIGIRSSTVRTFSGAEIIIPNGNLISSEVTNWTLSDRLRRIEISVGVAYGTDPKKVVTILKDLAVNQEEVLKNPEPLVLFKGFGESSLDFELRFWTANYDNWLNLKSDMTILIEEAIKKAKIEIPFPQRDLHVRSVDAKIQQST